MQRKDEGGDGSDATEGAKGAIHDVLRGEEAED